MLSTDSIVAGYGELEVVHGVSLTVAPGEAVGLLGLNGAGKSTLISVIAGHRRAWGGAVLINGQDVTKAPPHSPLRSTVALVAENRDLFPALTVEENLRAAMITSRLRRSVVAERIEAVTEPFPILRKRRNQAAGLLSGGQQQMLAIARAMTNEPKLLLLDEPSLGLAPALVAEIYERLSDLRTSGISMLIVEQHVHEVVKLCERMYVLDLGVISHEGPTSDMKEDVGFAEAYLGG
jgi:branched-chain amino acid transport system ATP-binding protein